MRRVQNERLKGPRQLFKESGGFTATVSIASQPAG